MIDLTVADRPAIEARRDELAGHYEDFRARGLALDMTRGKPCAEQLALADGMLELPGSDYCATDGTDCRNYGGLDGLAEAKELFAAFLGVGTDEIIIGGNSSLQMMYDAIIRAMVYGVPGGDGPWGKLPVVKFLCPSPGYDRHFKICEHLGIEMITVEMTPTGPEMDQVERLVATDAAVKAIWCVPKYSNPTGVTFSDETVARLAKMPAASPDVRILWDNAYAVHHLSEDHDELAEILAACKDAGNADRALIFGSTSKVSFAGAGLAMMGGSTANIADAKDHISFQTIGPDKLNQLRHLRFFGDMVGIEKHMKRHAEILRPKFDAVLEILDARLAGSGVADWSHPNGGYFISLDVMDGCAKEVVARAAEAGVKLTPAGATYPGGNDPRDRNIRIAPTLPPLEEVKTATELLSVCVQLVASEKLLR